MNYTKGPWKMWQADKMGVYISSTDDERESFASGVCIIQNDNDRQGDGTMEANARLILKAPEMYKLLKDMNNAIDVTVTRNKYQAKIWEVLDAIEGRS